MEKKELYAEIAEAVVLYFVICVVVQENGKLWTENVLRMFMSLQNALIAMVGANLYVLFA